MKKKRLEVFTDKEEWLKMVSGAEDAVEDFNGFIDDRAILWAANRIKELEKELSTVSKDRKDLLAEYLYQLHMDEAKTLTADVDNIQILICKFVVEDLYELIKFTKGEGG